MNLIIVLFTVLFSVFANGITFSIDKPHSYVGFEVKYMMLSNVKGNFQEFQGFIEIEEDEIVKINGSIEAKSINTSNEKRDKHLRSDDFFNVEEYKMIYFETREMKKTEEGYVAIGQLEMHGIKKMVSIPIKVTDIMIDANGKKRLGVSGRLTINRRDYGITYSKKLDGGGLVIGDEVNIELMIQATSST